jgi:hypothetical protein
VAGLGHAPEVDEFPTYGYSVQVLGTPEELSLFIQERISEHDWTSRTFTEGPVINCTIWPAVKEPAEPGIRRDRRASCLIQLSQGDRPGCCRVSARYLISSRGFAERTWRTTPEDVTATPHLARVVRDWFKGRPTCTQPTSESRPAGSS